MKGSVGWINAVRWQHGWPCQPTQLIFLFVRGIQPWKGVSTRYTGGGNRNNRENVQKKTTQKERLSCTNVPQMAPSSTVTDIALKTPAVVPK